MRILAAGVLLLVFLISFHAQSTIVIEDVAIVDVVAGRPRPRMTVVIEGNRITAVGRRIRIPRNATVIDGSGKFLIPGLWDMHVHVLDPERARIYLPLLMANGVTGVRDMGTTADGLAMLEQLRKGIPGATLIAPRIIAAGRIMDGAKPAVPRNSIPFTGPIDAREQVRLLKRSGADFIKVYDGVSPEEYYAIVDEAKKLAMPFVGHVPNALTSFHASEAGQKSFEHLGNILRSCSSLDMKTIEDRATSSVKPSGKPGDFSHIPARIAARTKIELETFDKKKCEGLYAGFVRNTTWQVPTLATKRPLSLFDDGGFTDDPRMKYIPAKELENWKPENNFFLKFRTPEFIIQKKNLYLKELQLVRDMHRAGVPFMAGTDIPGAYTYPGFSLHDELELLVENGFTPLEALQAATINPAKFLGLQKSLGTVAVGKTADLVLLDGNPLAEIKNTTRINAVIVEGRVLDRRVLDRLLSEVEAKVGKQ